MNVIDETLREFPEFVLEAVELARKCNAILADHRMSVTAAAMGLILAQQAFDAEGYTSDEKHLIISEFAEFAQSQLRARLHGSDKIITVKPTKG